MKDGRAHLLTKWMAAAGESVEREPRLAGLSRFREGDTRQKIFTRIFIEGSQNAGGTTGDAHLRKGRIKCKQCSCQPCCSFSVAVARLDRPKSNALSGVSPWAGQRLPEGAHLNRVSKRRSSAMDSHVTDSATWHACTSWQDDCVLAQIPSDQQTLMSQQANIAKAGCSNGHVHLHWRLLPPPKTSGLSCWVLSSYCCVHPG